MDLEDLKVYNLAMDLGERIWNIVDRWTYFQKDTVGKQLVKAADSIAANLSEGYGRYHYREAKNFGYYSRGSLYETRTWIQKAANRDLLSKIDFEIITSELQVIVRMLNNYIKSIGGVSEPPPSYGAAFPDDL